MSRRRCRNCWYSLKCQRRSPASLERTFGKGDITVAQTFAANRKPTLREALAGRAGRQRWEPASARPAGRHLQPAPGSAGGCRRNNCDWQAASAAAAFTRESSGASACASRRASNALCPGGLIRLRRAFDPAQVIAQLRVHAACCSLQAAGVPPRPAVRAAGVARAAVARPAKRPALRQRGIGPRRLEPEVVGLRLAACQHRLQRLFTAALGAGIIGRHCQNGEKSFAADSSCPRCARWAWRRRRSTACANASWLAGRSAWPASNWRARCVQCGPASSPRPASARCCSRSLSASSRPSSAGRLSGCSDRMRWNRQRAAVTFIQPTRSEGVARLRQQCTDAGIPRCAGPAAGAPRRPPRPVVPAVPGQCQRLRAAVEIVGLHLSRACCRPPRRYGPGLRGPADDLHPAPARP